jgi:hypothetical protein
VIIKNWLRFLKIQIIFLRIQIILVFQGFQINKNKEVSHQTNKTVNLRIRIKEVRKVI